MKTELFIEYAKLKQTEKATQARIKELGPLIGEEMQALAKENGVELKVIKVPSPYGNFSWMVRPRYVFSDRVKEAEKKVDDLKKEEIASGTYEDKIEDLILQVRQPKTNGEEV